jgi:hypothetical protein
MVSTNRALAFGETEFGSPGGFRTYTLLVNKGKEENRPAGWRPWREPDADTGVSRLAVRLGRRVGVRWSTSRTQASAGACVGAGSSIAFLS